MKPSSTAGWPAEPRARLALPPEQPLPMPRQLLHAQAQRTRGGTRSLRAAGTLLARLLLLGGTLGLSWHGITEMHGVVSDGVGITLLQWVFLVLFALNFTWISFACCQAVLGFFLLLLKDLFGGKPLHDRPPGIHTAVLAPVYNEDPARVVAGIRAMRNGLIAEAPERFAFFILSDTTNPAAWLHEERVFRELLLEQDNRCPVYYRHRRHNTERKAGNIADWVQRWGGGYEAMLVLDADSIMAPSTLIEMARRLEADPGLGLLQTLPSIVLAETLYGRLQQFANRLYGPVFANGLAAWHGNGSNFWGHNAIIRTAAFAGCAHLPVLSGKPPFGGHVISHDFIEAALLRRAGWSVRFDTDLPQSYEEAPPSVSDVLVRDRRWCQGNLQHARFLFARGLRITTRLHLCSGIMAYVSALLWLALLAVGMLLAIQAGLTPTNYFPEPGALFPAWPTFNTERAISLFILSMSIVVLPKLLALLSALLNPLRLWRFGGPLLPLSVALEMLLSGLFAPVMMVAQSRMVWDIFSGSDSGWTPQRRDDGSIRFGAALRLHWWHTLLGLATIGITGYLQSDLFWWLLPVTSGLVLSAPLSWLSGKRTPGRLLKRLWLLRTPEESRPPPILTAVQAERQVAAGQAAQHDISPLTHLLEDPAFRAWHLKQLTAHTTDPQALIPELVLARAKAARAGSAGALENWLTPGELKELFHAPDLLEQLARRHGLGIGIVASEF